MTKVQAKKWIQQKDYAQLFHDLCEQKNEQVIFNDNDDWISILSDAEILKSAVIYNSELTCQQYTEIILLTVQQQCLWKWVKRLFEFLKNILFSKDLKKMLIKFEFLSQMLTDLQLPARNHNVNSEDIDSEYNDNVNY